MSYSVASTRQGLTLLLIAFWLHAGFALAQSRTIPANAKRAAVGQAAPLPYVNLSGKRMTLAPGGVIYDVHNRAILHQALPPGEDVAYTTDLNGDVARIYILTPQEQAQFDKKR